MRLLISIIIYCLSFASCTVSSSKHEEEKDTLSTIKEASNIEASPFYKNQISSDSVICINIWATWCAPCVEEMPILNEIKENYKDRKVAFISFSLDSDTTQLMSFTNKNKFHFADLTMQNLPYLKLIKNFLAEEKDLTSKISMYAIPKTYLIKNKKVLEYWNRQVEKGEVIKAINANL
jgi:thiol-disulfide isomerase/thioredoxin